MLIMVIHLPSSFKVISGFIIQKYISSDSCFTIYSDIHQRVGHRIRLIGSYNFDIVHWRE